MVDEQKSCDSSLMWESLRQFDCFCTLGTSSSKSLYDAETASCNALYSWLNSWAQAVHSAMRGMFALEWAQTLCDLHSSMIECTCRSVFTWHEIFTYSEPLTVTLISFQAQICPLLMRIICERGGQGGSKYKWSICQAAVAVYPWGSSCVLAINCSKTYRDRSILHCRVIMINIAR